MVYRYDLIAEFGKQTSYVYFVLLKTQQSAAGIVQGGNTEAKPFVGVRAWSAIGYL